MSVQPTHVRLLQLLQLSDSAIPIGSTAHSFGLEIMAALAWTDADNLVGFLSAHLEENGLSDAIFCRAAYACNADELATFCDQLSALRTARELRTASIVMGRRLLRLVQNCDSRPQFLSALHISNLHHALAFGFIAGVLQIDLDDAIAAFLHQSIATLISAAQRLLPIGQHQASQMLWAIKPEIESIAHRSAGRSPDQAFMFAPMLEIASMRHKRLETRLFIS